ncbi:UNVERIFIED_ORG: hypothetical protein LHK14_13235 [Roseateles sp. XES5]|nr:hypothetical protein [Roseateles sp. XES5]
MTANLPTTHARIKDRVKELAAMVNLIDGETLAADINTTADRLAALMQRMHGGKWSIDIDHDTCFVAVCRDFPDEREVKR